jgi:hypothetical protein
MADLPITNVGAAVAFIHDRVNHHSHDLGEFGKVIKCDYLKDILDEVLAHDKAGVLHGR